MKISTKGKYAIAAIIYLAENTSTSKPITAAAISSSLDISKPYLEQILAIFKNSGILKSVKGSFGGFMLAKAPEEISLYDILSETELVLVGETEQLVIGENSAIHAYIPSDVWSKLDDVISSFLKNMSVKDILDSKIA